MAKTKSKERGGCDEIISRSSEDFFGGRGAGLDTVRVRGLKRARRRPLDWMFASLERGASVALAATNP